MGAGRPSMYTDELADEICSLMADGMPLTKICKMDGVPSYQTILNWLADPNKKEFLGKYVRAREAQADTLAEEILEIADDVALDWAPDAEGKSRLDHEHVTRSKLRMEARKWLASKMQPKKYGERQTIAGDKENPLEVRNSFVDTPAKESRDEWLKNVKKGD